MYLWLCIKEGITMSAKTIPVSLYGAKLIPINASLFDYGYGPGDQYLADVLIGCVSFM